MLAGAGIKILCSVLLIPVWGMMAAPTGTFFCYLTVTGMNLFFVIRHTGIRLDTVSTFIKPLTASAICAVSAYLVFILMRICIPEKLAVFPAIVFAVPVYILLTVSMRVLQPADFSLLPGMEKWFRKLHIPIGNQKTKE